MLRAVSAALIALSYAVYGENILPRRIYNDPAYNETFFPSLENYQVNASEASEEQYPWVARVVHSRSRGVPVVCTAVCVQPRIFITAARCIYNLKVEVTTVVYQKQNHHPIAFVLPRNETKQAFDDVGLVVVDREPSGSWPTIALLHTKRTDPGFKWFAELNLSYGPHSHWVVAYTTRKGMHRMRSAERIFGLHHMDVIVGIGICQEILTRKNRINGFFVPCYHSCNLQDFEAQNGNCKRYIGGEGGAVIDSKVQKLLGVATWGAYSRQYELPVGFSVPNSDSFFKDYECAMRIRDDTGVLVSAGYYQSLCPE